MTVESYICNLFVILHLVFILDCSSGVRVTELLVPSLADPRSPLTLSCAYELGGEELHSVKWYKDEQEFFRYAPRQQPRVMSFPVAGVHVEARGTACDAHQCSVQLEHLTARLSGGVYKCEVSTEAPKFRVGVRAGNVTVAAVGRAEPRVVGVRGVYAVGELVQAGCTAAPADPAPRLSWLLNGQPAPAGTAGQQRVSQPDRHGLVVASRGLRLVAERRHFPLELVCVAAPPPGVPASPRASPPAAARLLDPQAATHQQLEWLHGSALIQRVHQGLLTVVLITIFCR